MNSFAAHIAPICGCATSMRKTLSAPTITFSSQKSSRVAKTVQPKNTTPASGARFAATSTRALGESRRARRAGAGGVTAPQRCNAAKAPPGACRPRRRGGSCRRERFDQGVGRGGDLRQPVQHIQVAHAGGIRAGAASAAGRNDPAGGSGYPPRRAVARPGNESPGDGGARGGEPRGDRRRGDAGVPRHLQRAAQTLLRSATAGQPGGQGRRADRDGAWGRPFPGGGPRPAAAVREAGRHGGGERRVRDELAVSGREARSRAAAGGGPGGARSAGARYGRPARTSPTRHMSNPATCRAARCSRWATTPTNTSSSAVVTFA